MVKKKIKIEYKSFRFWVKKKDSDGPPICLVEVAGTKRSAKKNLESKYNKKEYLIFGSLPKPGFKRDKKELELYKKIRELDAKPSPKIRGNIK